IREWEYVLDKLEEDPIQLSDRLDWVAKFKMLQLYMDSEGVDWDDDALFSIDLEYHNINPNEGLLYVLQRNGGVRRVTTDEKIEEAMMRPPNNTRAYARSRVIRELIKRGVTNYIIEWDCISLVCGLFNERQWFIMDDPFETYDRHATWFIQRLR
ncbi:MAG: proteasome accessory factor PafA2 family protein, partial [Armatimonadetes bacterium]|nr:proteasome accessory factor PafA2 family protein [Armatimonadota bacterium]